MNDLVLYEFPLNERIRAFLRLELLFQQIDHSMQGDTVWDSRQAVTTLLEILAIFSRNDLKSETLKELERHSSMMSKIPSNRLIDTDKRDSITAELSRISDALYATPGKIGNCLMESELLKGVNQRTPIPGGTCGFDLPAYHYWLQRHESLRKKDLEQWLSSFTIIREGIELLLGFIRQSATPVTETAQKGFFQKTLDHSLPYQLLRVGLPDSLPCYAEISGGKHRFTIRLMNVNAGERPTQINENIPFELTCCII